MAGSSRSRRSQVTNYWPGFVDALSTMLLAITFLLSVFMLAQFFLAQEITSKETVLDRLNRQITELTDLLSLERSSRRTVEQNLATLQTTLQSAEQERGRLQGMLGNTPFPVLGREEGCVGTSDDFRRLVTLEASRPGIPAHHQPLGADQVDSVIDHGVDEELQTLRIAQSLNAPGFHASPRSLDSTVGNVENGW